MAWAEVVGHIPPAAIVMWIGAVAWQIGYDTVYAYVDVNDDLRLGLKSTPVLFDKHGKTCIGLFYGLAAAAWALGGWLAGMSPLYDLGILVIAGHLAWQTWRLDLRRPDVNFSLFLSNILTGTLLSGAVLKAGVNGYLDRVALHDVVFHEIHVGDRRLKHKNVVVKQLAVFLGAGACAGAWSVTEPHLTAVMLFGALHDAVDDALADGPKLTARRLDGASQNFSRAVGII